MARKRYFATLCSFHAHFLKCFFLHLYDAYGSKKTVFLVYGWQFPQGLYPFAIRVSLDSLDAIFHYLLLCLNRSASHKELYEAVWKKEYLRDDMNIMAHIHRMRKKMGDDIKNPRYIQNVYGIGYMVEGVYRTHFYT